MVLFRPGSQVTVERRYHGDDLTIQLQAGLAILVLTAGHGDEQIVGKADINHLRITLPGPHLLQRLESFV